MLSQNILIGAGRLVFSLLLVALQLYVLRAARRGLGSLNLAEDRYRRLSQLTAASLIVLNLPLLYFLVEGFVAPRSVLLYSPPPRFEALVRPISYLFFIWTLGSLLFCAASPVVMAGFAVVQFFGRRLKAWEQGSTISVLDLSRRRFLQTGLTAVACMPFAASAYGAVAARSRNVVERVVVPITGLPPQLEGFRIVQLSDIHAGLFMTAPRISEYVSIANELKPDLIALTGDFVATTSRQVGPFLDGIKALEAKHGVYGCLGNHDVWTHSESRLEHGFEEAGFRLLRGRNDYIDIDGARLNVIGVDYIGRGSRDTRLETVLKNIPRDGTTLLLSHAPNTFPDAARSGIHLTLSGHTHGGQIGLTFGDLILSPVSLTTMFVAGLFKIGDSHLYVNRGLGTTGPPIRINAPPEITQITLTTA